MGLLSPTPCMFGPFGTSCAAGKPWWQCPGTQPLSGDSVSLGGEGACIKWQFTVALWKCFLQDLAIICYLLLLPTIAVNFVLYSGKCMERVIKPAATSQVRHKCWEMLLSWKDHPEGHCSGPDTITIDSSSMTFLTKRKRRLYLRRAREKYYIYL